MIVAYQPGGSIRDARVVLRFDEKIPNKFNTEESVIYREEEHNTSEWTLVKPKYSVLPSDSPFLSQPAMPEVESLPLTTPENESTLYEHVDIIRMEDE